ncbi:MAG: hypothetical protein ACTHYO_16665 [Micrococcaceae bacterium]
MKNNYDQREHKRQLREIDRAGARKARKALHETMRKRGYTVPTRGKRSAA